MMAQTKSTILTSAKRLFAKNGYEGFSMRALAKESGVGPSSIYHFFKDKDEILLAIFNATNTELGIARAKLPKTDTASQMLLDRIKFQFIHIEDIIFVLKYFIHFRPRFLRIDSGYLPAKGYLHIEEVLEVGLTNGEFAIRTADISELSKVIAHSINGFLLEYYPDPPQKSELESVSQSIHSFVMRSLTNKEVPMK